VDDESVSERQIALSVKPRILIIENSIAATGALEAIMRSSIHQIDHFDFIFLLPKNSKAIELVREKGFKVLELPMKELRKKLLSIVIYLPVLLLNTIRLNRLIQKNKIDSLVCNDFYNLLPVAHCIIFGKINYICYVRFLPSKFPRVLVQLWFELHCRFAKKIIAVSHAVEKGLPTNEKVIVIYSELPDDDVNYTPSQSTVILYPANYISGKGQEYALKAFAQVHAKYPQWMLRFVGGDMGLEKNGAFKKSLEAMSENLDIQNQVQWNGFSNNLKEEYLNAGLVLNFSDSESFSLTCLEGLFYGRPVIATRCGGPEEIIDDFKSGLLVPIKNVEDMASAIDNLLKDETQRQKIGADAYDAIRKKFDSKNTVERLLSLYLEYLSQDNK
jgi:glycosyltransferase involved in cell wall biosynthesis